MEAEIGMTEIEVIMVREINVPPDVMVAVVETEEAETVVVGTEEAETVAVEIEVAAEVEVVKAVTEIDVLRINPQKPETVETLEDIGVRLEVKITSQARNHRKDIKVVNLKVVEIIVAVEEAIVVEEISDVESNHSSSVIFCFIFEKIPWSSIISLAPGKTDKISSVINPVFL